MPVRSRASFRKTQWGSLDQSESNWSAALSGRFKLSDSWSATAGVGRATRTANSLERYSDRFPSTKFQLAAEVMGNPGLDPEAAVQLDVGVSGLASSGLAVQAELFWREIDDYITVAPDPTLPKRLPLSPPVVYRYINGEASFVGGEIRLSQRVNQVIAWRASASYVRAEDDTFDEPVLGIPPLTGVLGVTLTSPNGRFTGEAEVVATDRQDRVASSRGEQETPGYTTLDLSAGYALTGGLSLQLAVLNATDKEYAHHLNSPSPFSRLRIPERGRSVRFGVRLRR